VPITASSLRDPVRWSSGIQLLKTVVAAVIAWVLASQTFQLPQAFLAPWAALLVVHATVYRTFSRGAQQVVGAVLGVLLAWVVGNFLGLTTTAVAALLVLGLLLGALRWFRDESTTIAATGLIVLTTGFSTQDQVLVDRLYDTAIGIGVGLVVNLCDEEQVTAWVDRTRGLDDEIEHAWALLRQAKESGRLNPRRAARSVRTTDVFEGVLRDNEQAVAETRSMARTLGYSIDGLVEWEPAFSERWLDLLQTAGEAITAPDPERVSDVRSGLQELAHDLSNQELSARHWPEYGALIMNLRNVVTSMDQVARHHHLELPRYVRRERFARRVRIR
jgi:hypothetical protein